jgi:DNA polymerase IV
MDFNPARSELMHIDINSCFAAIEQQANPLLRGKPVVVAAYPTANGCILASSKEAKVLGVKTGMKVKEAKVFFSNLAVLSPDPEKYRFVHLKLKKLLDDYSSEVVPKSIDEFTLKPACLTKNIRETAIEIKERIKKEIGSWLTVSVGIAPNRFLAKTASNLHKPDGLDEINRDNFLKIYSDLSLTDLCGIKSGNIARLNRFGIYSVLDFYNASSGQLKRAFASICGYYWYLRLHGYEVDDFNSRRASYGNSYALPKPFSTLKELSPVLAKLVEKTGSRLRLAGFKAKGIHLAVFYRDGSFWHKGTGVSGALFDSRDIYGKAVELLKSTGCTRPVKNIAVSVFNLFPGSFLQLEMFNDAERKSDLVNCLDKINNRWGQFTITGARMCGTEKLVPDRIAFGQVGEL